MSNPSSRHKTRVPWHLWVIGVISLLWNAMGAMDFVMTQTKNETYMSSFTAEQLEFFYGFPVWVIGSWAVAVWGGVLGSLFLLLRRKFALHLFLASLLCMFATAIHNYGFSNGLEVAGDVFSLIFTAAIIMIGILFYLYARVMCQRTVLR